MISLLIDFPTGKHFLLFAYTCTSIYICFLSLAINGLINHIIFSVISINSLPNDKFLDWFKLKAFADNNINVTEELKFVLKREENIVGKGESAGYQHFLLFPQCFQKTSYTGLLKVGIVW